MNISMLMKKDIKEIFRTYRIYVIPIIFLVFGLSSPIIAKLLPEIIKSMTVGFEIQVPEPTWLDAFSQFFKNNSQIGMLVVVLVMMGAVADEKARGTALMVLSKPVSRYSFVISKYVVNVIFLLLSLGIAYAACLYNTYVLFPEVEFANTLAATLIFAVYLVFVGSVTIFASSLVTNSVGAGGIALGILFASSILAALSRVFRLYSPGGLTAYRDAALVYGFNVLEDAVWAIIITLALSLLLAALASFIFAKQEL